MYVVSINDFGEERNFLATSLSFSGSQLNATVDGKLRQFEVGQLIDIETVEEVGLTEMASQASDDSALAEKKPQGETM